MSFGMVQYLSEIGRGQRHRGCDHFSNAKSTFCHANILRNISEWIRRRLKKQRHLETKHMLQEKHKSQKFCFLLVVGGGNVVEDEQHVACGVLAEVSVGRDNEEEGVVGDYYSMKWRRREGRWGTDDAGGELAVGRHWRRRARGRRGQRG